MSETNLSKFDPNAVGNKNAGIYGLPFTPEDSQTVLVPVPWDVTTSYGGGTSRGPEAIFEASYQVDLFHPDFPAVWEPGIAMFDINQDWIQSNDIHREKAAQIITALENGEEISESETLTQLQAEVNAESERLNDWVEAQMGPLIEQGKLVGLIGGDHSTPLGFLRALAKRYDHFGILHIDAHMDLREAYEGFTYSHASIMYNALGLNSIARLVQVGIRDYCEQEWYITQNSKGRVKVFTDKEIKDHLFIGKSFESMCKKIINSLPDLVYISLDIDGLNPALCPNTGTPVPGGLSFEEVNFLLQMLQKSGKQVIGFDMVEVCPGEDAGQWDANVGARMLYNLIGYSC